MIYFSKFRFAKLIEYSAIMKKTAAKVILAEGKYLRLVRHGHWEYAERNNATGAVVIVAVTTEGKLILTEQYRTPVKSAVIELPAGLVGDIPGEEDEAWETAAQRELLEETGYLAKKVKKVAGGPISAGFGTEMISIFLATRLQKIEAGGGVDGEDIRVHEVALSRVPAWLRKKEREGLQIDPKVFAGLYFAAQVAPKPAK